MIEGAYQVVLAVDHGLSGVGAVGGHLRGTVSSRLATQPEVRAGRSQRLQVNGRAGVGRDDAEGTIRALGRGVVR